jgi:pilus assembly protein CpaC
VKLSLILLIFITNIALAQLKETPLNIAIGIDEIVKFDYKYNPKVQVGNSSLIKLKLAPSKQEIIFRGVKPGKTSVTIRDAVGDPRDKFIVTITSDGNSSIVSELRELIGDIEGVEIKIRGGKVIVDGHIVVPNDIGRVMTVLARYPDVLILLEYADQTKVIVARKMQEMINRNGMKDVTVRVVNGDYWLEGVVNSGGKKDLSEKLAVAYLPDVLLKLGQASGGDRFKGNAEKGMGIMNFISVNEKKDPEPPAKLVKISAQFVELSKDYQKVFAFKWAPFMKTDSQIGFGKTATDGITTSENGTLSGTISRLFPKLNSAKQAGYARVIQSGMVVSNEGKPVTITKSSQIDFAVGTGEGQKAQSASITFELKTTPRIGIQENVSLDGLSIKVSLPNGTDSNNNTRVTTNSVSTNITVKSKESAVIGGVIQSNSITDYDKDDPDPVEAGGEEGSAQSSPLFNLLRSKKYATTKSQFVMFVTPEILESASKGTEEIRKKFRKRER